MHLGPCNRLQVDPVRSGWCECKAETLRTEWGKAGGGEGCEAGAADLCGATSSEQLVVLSRLCAGMGGHARGPSQADECPKHSPRLRRGMRKTSTELE